MKWHSECRVVEIEALSTLSLTPMWEKKKRSRWATWRQMRRFLAAGARHPIPSAFVNQIRCSCCLFFPLLQFWQIYQNYLRRWTAGAREKKILWDVSLSRPLRRLSEECDAVTGASAPCWVPSSLMHRLLRRLEASRAGCVCVYGCMYVM